MAGRGGPSGPIRLCVRQAVRSTSRLRVVGGNGCVCGRAARASGGHRACTRAVFGLLATSDAVPRVGSKALSVGLPAWLNLAPSLHPRGRYRGREVLDNSSLEFLMSLRPPTSPTGSPRPRYLSTNILPGRGHIKAGGNFRLAAVGGREGRGVLYGHFPEPEGTSAGSDPRQSTRCPRYPPARTKTGRLP